MRVGLRSLAVVCLCFLLTLQNAWGWNSIGHMAAAYVAFERLTPKQQARVTALLALNPSYADWSTNLPANTASQEKPAYIFMLAATWPDQIKGTIKGYKDDGNTPPDGPQATLNEGYSDKFMHKYWHYVDVPFSPDGTALGAASTVNAQTEIALLRKGIASSEPDAVKSYDLAWLVHLVGDVHQPLHCTSRFTAATPTGDQGGNLVKLDGPARNLHAYWDDLLGSSDYRAPAATGEPADIATALAAAKLLVEADATQAADLNEADWVKESFALDQSSVYVNPPIGTGVGPYSVSTATNYNANSLKIAQQRVELAGERLAGILSGELK